MRAVSIVSLVLAAGCERAVYGPLDAPGECLPSVVQTPEEAGWTGLTEEEVLAELEAFVPVSVSWTRMSPNVPQSDIAVTWTRTGLPAQVIERVATENAPCRLGPELVLELAFEVALGTGEVGAQSRFVGTISADLDGELWADGEGDAVLDETWDKAGHHAIDDRTPNVEQGPASWHLWLGERWGRAEVGIYGTNEDEGWSALAWAGHWSQIDP